MLIGGTVNTETNVSIKHKPVKNTNWWEAADQLAIYNHGREVETLNYCVTSPVGGQVGIEPVILD